MHCSSTHHSRIITIARNLRFQLQLPPANLHRSGPSIVTWERERCFGSTVPVRFRSVKIHPSAVPHSVFLVSRSGNFGEYGHATAPRFSTSVGTHRVVRRRQAPAGRNAGAGRSSPRPLPGSVEVEAVGCELPTNRGPGQEVGFRARLSGKESSRGAEAAPGWLQVLGGSRGAAAAGLENSWRRLGGWVASKHQQSPNGSTRRFQAGARRATTTTKLYSAAKTP